VRSSPTIDGVAGSAGVGVAGDGGGSIAVWVGDGAAGVDAWCGGVGFRCGIGGVSGVGAIACGGGGGGGGASTGLSL
jgi:hypothetical protein